MDNSLSSQEFWSRFQFGFTLTYYYLFSQLTMGLAWLLVYWKWRAFKTGDDKYKKPPGFGPRYSASILPWALSPGYRCNFSSGRIGPNSLNI